MDYLAVAIAGFLGAVTRAALGKLIKAGFTSAFPLNTLIINLTGCFVLSFFLTLTVDRLAINPKLRLAVGTGFLGAYTTFSTFALESINLLRSNLTGLSLAYILSTSLGCVLFAWFGVVLSRVMTARPVRESAE
ncbi:MAG: fluoride efflux transporter CrcB [Clostridia bacterium]|nr:fluoride efflux transporter CrcB [Clostridia bacterium]